MIPFAPDFTLGYDLKYSYSGTISSNTTTDGTAVDAIGYEGPVHIMAILGDCGDATTTITISLIECADSAGSYTAVTGATTTLTGSATANDNITVMLKADNWKLQYLKVRVVTAAGSSISCVVSAAIFAKKKIAAGSGIKTNG